MQLIRPNAVCAAIAVFFMVGGAGTVHGQTPAIESEKDPVVLTVLGPAARRADRIAAYLQRVQIENLLKTFVDPDASRVAREQARRQLIEEIKKRRGKELLLELIKNRKDLEAAAVTLFADAQPELSEVQLVREVLLSTLVSASAGEIAMSAAVGIVRQAQEAYLWRGVDSTVDTASLGHALIGRIQGSTERHWRDGVLKKLYDEASTRRKHATDPTEVDFFEAILADLHDYSPPPPIHEDRKEQEPPQRRGLRAVVRALAIAGIVVLGACGIILLKNELNNKPDRAPKRIRETVLDVRPREKLQSLVPVLTDLPREEIKGKRALVRADLDFLDEWGKLLSDASFEHVLPTIRLLQEQEAEKIILLGTAQRDSERVKELFDMQRIGEVLQEQLKLPVRTLRHWKGADAATAVDQAPPSHIVLLGNIGADPWEKEENEKKRQGLANELAALRIDLYINDAPRASKHAYASTVELAQKVSKAVAGPLLNAVVSGQGTFSKKQQQSVISKLPGAQALLGAATINSTVARTGTFFT